jgi:hypothetical protein
MVYPVKNAEYPVLLPLILLPAQPLICKVCISGWRATHSKRVNLVNYRLIKPHNKKTSPL